jgi:multidrug efflux pump subunit AcrB
MLGSGTGSELRHPLGLAIVGGLARQPDADAVHDAGHLHLVRRVGAAVPPPQKRQARAGAAQRRRDAMNITKVFIERPVATTLLTLGLALAGLVSYFLLAVAPLPSVDMPVIFVSASMPGASPEVMASTVATPLERHLGTIAGVNEMTSSSSVGSSRVVLQFDMNRDIDGAARDVQAAIVAARADLPAALKSNPTYRKMNPADQPVMILALTSDTLTPGQIYDSASTIMQQKLSQVSGIGQVQARARRCRRCASTSIRGRCSNTASGSKPCAPP